MKNLTDSNLLFGRQYMYSNFECNNKIILKKLTYYPISNHNDNHPSIRISKLHIEVDIIGYEDSIGLGESSVATLTISGSSQTRSEKNRIDNFVFRFDE